MSFIILLLIVILIYATLSTYGSVIKVVFMSLLVTGMTVGFLLYGLHELTSVGTFSILNTKMNMTVFIHACIVWFAADIIVLYKIVTNYRFYIEVNTR